MKKIISSALLVLLFLFSIPVHADEPLKFGVKAGLNVSDFYFDSEVFDKTNQAGWFIGPTVKFTLPIVGLGMDASVLYDYRAAKLDYATMTQTVKQQQIAIPVNARYSIGLGSMASVFIFGGPQVAFNIGEKEYQWNMKSTYALKNSNFSVNLGFGVTAFKHLQVSANYNIACGKTGHATWKTATDAATSAFKKKDSRNSSWQVGGSLFLLKRKISVLLVSNTHRGNYLPETKQASSPV